MTRVGAGTANVGEIYRIDFDATDPGDDRVSEWRVDWGDGTTEVFGTGSRSATHIYDEPGSYNVVVGAVDEDTTPNATNAPVLQVLVGVQPSQVSAGGPYFIAEGDSLSLSATAVGAPVSFDWDLNADPFNPSFSGDATGQNPTLTWAQLQGLSTNPINNNGTTSILVRATYGTGLTVISEVALLTVANAAPTATLDPIAPVTEGTGGGVAVVSFAGAFDPSNADTANGFFYSYDFDNDGIFEIENSNQPSAFIPAAFLSDDGVSTVRGRIADIADVNDPSGGFTDLFADYTILEVAPTLSAAGSPEPVAEGAIYTLNLSASDPGDDAIDRWTIDWGDGSAPQTVTDPAPSVTHRFVDDGSFSISITAIDEDGVYTTGLAATVTNRAPTLSGLSATSVDENGVSVLTGTINDVGLFDTFTLDVIWGDNVAETFNFAAGTTDFAVVHQYLDDDPTTTASDLVSVSVTLSDDDDGDTIGGTTATVSNVAPEIASLGLVDEVIDEGGFAQVIGSITDIGGADSHTVVIDWGDGTSSNATVNATARTFTAEHRYLDDQPNADPDEYVITAVATDDDSGVSASASTTVTVNNQAAEISAISLAELTIGENDEAVLSGSFVDLGIQDTHQLMIDWGDGSAASSATITATANPNIWSFEARHVYLDDNPTVTPVDDYFVTATLTDGDGGVDTNELVITVENVAPAYLDLSNNAEQVGNISFGDDVVLTGLIADPGSQDTFVVEIDWGDGTAVEQVILAAGDRTFTASHLFLDPGFFTITATITDDDGGVDTAETEARLTVLEASEFLVNDSSNGFQDTYAETRNVAANEFGDMVITYAGTGPGDLQGIFARRYDATNTPLGPAFLVNVTTSSNQRFPSVAVGDGGEFVVTWSGPGAGDNDGGVFARLYDSNGVAVSGEIKVSQTTPSFQHKPVVAKAADGSFIITWSGNGVADAGGGVFARRFAANGVPLTGEFLVNTTTLLSQQEPDLAIAGDGSFVITWSGTGPGDASGVFFQRYDALGTPLGPETRANTTITGQQYLPSVAIDGVNNFTVVWSGRGNGDSIGVFLQRYDASGIPIDGEELVNTTTLYEQADASISMSPSGAAVITWSSLYQDGSGRGVYVQEYSAAGAKVGGEIQINDTTSQEQKFASVAVRGEAAYSVVWSGRGVGDTTGVFAATRHRLPVPLMAAAGQALGNTASGSLTQTDLDAVVAAAVQRFDNAGLSPLQLGLLSSIDARIADLAGGRLGESNGSTITIDVNAAGYGWFVDSTPLDDDEFRALSEYEQIAIAGSEADGKMDLLTAVMHEIGHLLGLDHAQAGTLMGATLATGTRYELDDFFSELGAGP